ncbi:MAG: leucine-rich repeat protein [Bacteroides sp.]|nr:leucine-rich repeat protein [Bacteroides sp.]
MAYEYHVDGIVYVHAKDDFGNNIPYELCVISIENSDIKPHVVIPSRVKLSESSKDWYAVTQIGTINSPSLVSVQLPSTIKIIWGGAFNKCYNLKSINLPMGLQEIRDHAFANCTSLEEIEIPNSVCKLEEYAFGNSGLRHVTLPLGLTDYGFDIKVFKDCQNLESAIIPSSSGLSVLPMGTFRNCPKLTSVSLPNSIKTIGGRAFDYTSLRTITLPDSLTKIEGCAFIWCTSLESITFPPTLENIEQYAFQHCSNLTSVEFLNNTNAEKAVSTSLEREAFGYCSSLKTVTLSNTMAKMTQPFMYCDSLRIIKSYAMEPPRVSALFETNMSWIYDNKRLYVPAKALTNYTSDRFWSSFPLIRILEAKPIDAEQLPSGQYYLTTAREEFGKYLTANGSTLVRTDDSAEPACCWDVEALGNNKYHIRNNTTGEYLMGSNCAATSAEPVELFLFNGQDAFGICLENDADSDKFLNAFYDSEYLTSWCYDAGSSWDFLMYDTSTEIEETTAVDSDQIVYDLAGRRVFGPLRSGIYIVDRKKIMIK